MLSEVLMWLAILICFLFNIALSSINLLFFISNYIEKQDIKESRLNEFSTKEVLEVASESEAERLVKSC